MNLKKISPAWWGLCFKKSSFTDYNSVTARITESSESDDGDLDDNVVVAMAGDRDFKKIQSH